MMWCLKMCLFQWICSYQSDQSWKQWGFTAVGLCCGVFISLYLFLDTYKYWGFFCEHSVKQSMIWMLLKVKMKNQLHLPPNQIRIAINSIVCVAANVKSFPWLRSLISTGDCAVSTAMMNQSLRSSESPLAWLCWGGSNLLLIRRASLVSH